MCGSTVFRLFSSIIVIVVVVQGSPAPFRANFQENSVNVHESRYGQTESADTYRLPNQVVPVSYELKIAPNLKTFTFKGEVNITVHVKFTTDRIILHSQDLEIGNVKVGGFENAPPITAIPEFDKMNDLLIIKTGQEFKYNANYTVSITFQGNIDDAYAHPWLGAFPQGFYRISYVIKDDSRHWLATTQFEVIGARRAFPCFDELRYRATFTVQLARSAKHIAISNMPSEAILPPDSMSDGLEYEKFQPTPPMPTYLLAYQVSDYKSLKSQDERIRVIARSNAIEKGKCDYASYQASRLLKYFEGYFGIPYALPKLDVVAVPDLPGAMENWGLTTYNERYVILENNNSKAQKNGITTVISHEFAHLWFGDLVTPAWYDYTWIKEGFASYFENFATAAIEPSWKQEDAFIVNVVQKTLWIDDGTIDRAMTWPTRNTKEIERSYGTIGYKKAGSVIRMFELMLSPSTFQNALHNYLKDGQQIQKGVAVQRNLFDAFDKQVELDSVSHLPPHVSASDIMKTWSENIGYPVINVDRSYEQGEVVITQTPYKPAIETENIRQNQKWIVPLTYTTKSQLQFSDTQPNHWSFADDPVKLSGFNKSDWVLFNIKQSGYYRVNYDMKNWNLLIEQLKEDRTKIHEINRAQLINDACALYIDGKINASIMHSLVQYLPEEKNIIPWNQASKCLQKLSSKNQNLAEQISFKNNLKEFLKKPVENFGCNILPTDDHITSALKPEFLKLVNKVGIEKCIKESLETYQKNHNNLNKIQQDSKAAVFCNALRYSNDPKKVYEHLWRHYETTDMMHEKEQILESIFSCMEDEEIIKSLLYKVTDPENEEISDQDISPILNEFPSEIPAVTASIQFIDEHVLSKSKLDKNGARFLKNLLISIDSKITTEEQLKLLKKLQTKFESMEQKKYADYTKMAKNMRIKAAEKITRDLKVSKQFQSGFLSLNKISAI